MRQVTVETTKGMQSDPNKTESLLQFGGSPMYHLAQVRFGQTLACWLHCLQQWQGERAAPPALIYLLPHQHELVITSPTRLSQYWVDFLLQRELQASY